MSENTEPQSFSLTVGDVENAVKAIDYACQKGAYTGWETIEEVKSIRDRLVLFLRQVAVPVNPAIPPESPAGEEAAQ